MASFNKIVIVGYLGRDPEIRFSPTGTAVCKFSIATTEKRKNIAGKPEDITTWFQAVTFGRHAEICNQYLSKGKQVYIEGRLRLDEWTDREGQPRVTLEVTVLDVQFIGSQADSSNSVGTYKQQHTPESPAPPQSAPYSAAPATAAYGSATQTVDGYGDQQGEEDEVPF